MPGKVPLLLLLMGQPKIHFNARGHYKGAQRLFRIWYIPFWAETKGATPLFISFFDDVLMARYF